MSLVARYLYLLRCQQRRRMQLRYTNCNHGADPGNQRLVAELERLRAQLSRSDRERIDAWIRDQWRNNWSPPTWRLRDYRTNPVPFPKSDVTTRLVDTSRIMEAIRRAAARSRR